MEHHIRKLLAAELQTPSSVFSVAVEPSHIFEIRDLRLELTNQRLDDSLIHRYWRNVNHLVHSYIQRLCFHPVSWALSSGEKMLFIIKSAKWLYTVYPVLTKYIQWLCSCSDTKESEWAGKAQICSQYNYRFLIIVTSMLTQLNKLQPAVFRFEEESLRWCESC